MLTRRGWTLLASTLGVAAGGALFGIQELYPVSLAGLTLLAASVLWVRGRRFDLATERDVRPVRVSAGRDARVELGVRNQASRRSPVLTVRDPFDGGRSVAELLLAPLEPGEATRAAYPLPTHQRGVFAVGPLELELVDPFGLARSVTAGADPSSLTVHPRIEPLRTLPNRAGDDRETGEGSPTIGRTGDEFYALREYRTGDDLRQVHWASTARLDKLMIRQSERLLRGRISIAVDLRSSVHTGASLEVALSAAASVADLALAHQVHVRVVTTARADTRFGVGDGHRAGILDELALAAPHRGTSLGSDLRFAGALAGGPAVVVTTDGATERDLIAGARLGARRGAVLVVVDRDRGAPPGRRPRPLPRVAVPVVRVPAGAAFATAWDQALGGRQKVRL